MSTGIKETEDLINLLTVVGKKLAGNPGIVKAFREKEWTTLGQFFAGLALDSELRAAGTAAFNGISNIKDELKDLSILEGMELGTDALDSAKQVYAAYNEAHDNV